MRTFIIAGVLALGLAVPGASASLAAPANGIAGVDELGNTILVERFGGRRSRQICSRRCRPQMRHSVRTSRPFRITVCSNHCRHH
jgi:hypothetical protein